jgi:hypothetical protein
MYDHINSIMNKDRLSIGYQNRNNYDEYRRSTNIPSVNFNDISMNYDKYPAPNKNIIMPRYNNEKVNMITFNNLESRQSPSNYSNYSNYSTQGTHGNELICLKHNKETRHSKPHLHHIIGNKLQINTDDSIFEDAYKIDNRSPSGYYSSRNKNFNYPNALNYYDRNYHEVNEKVENLESSLEVINSKLDYDLLNMKIHKMNKLAENIRTKSDYVEKMQKKSFTSRELEELQNAETLNYLYENSEIRNYRKPEEKNNYYNYQNNRHNDFKNFFVQQKNIDFSSTPSQMEINNNFSYNVNSSSNKNSDKNLIFQKSQSDFIPSTGLKNRQEIIMNKNNYEEPLIRKTSQKEIVENFSIQSSAKSLQSFIPQKDDFIPSTGLKNREDIITDKINYEEPLIRKTSHKEKVENFSIQSSAKSLQILNPQKDDCIPSTGLKNREETLTDKINYEVPVIFKISQKEKVENFSIQSSANSLQILNPHKDDFIPSTGFKKSEETLTDKINYEVPVISKIPQKEKVENFSIQTSAKSLQMLNPQKDDYIPLMGGNNKKKLVTEKINHEEPVILKISHKEKVEDFSIQSSSNSLKFLNPPKNDFIPTKGVKKMEELVPEKINYEEPVVRKISQKEKVVDFSIQSSTTNKSLQNLNPQKDDFIPSKGEKKREEFLIEKFNYEEPVVRKISQKEKVVDFSIESSTTNKPLQNLNPQNDDFKPLKGEKKREEFKTEKINYEIPVNRKIPQKEKNENFSIESSTTNKPLQNLNPQNDDFIPLKGVKKKEEFKTEKINYEIPVIRKVSQKEKVENENFSIQSSTKSLKNLNPQKVENLNIIQEDKNEYLNFKKFSNLPQVSQISQASIISIISPDKKNSPCNTNIEEPTGRMLELKKENEIPIIDLEKTRRKLNFETDQKNQSIDSIELSQHSQNHSNLQEPEINDFTFDINRDNNKIYPNFQSEDLTSSPNLKKGRHFKRRSISPHDFKKIINLSDFSKKKKVTFLDPEEEQSMKITDPNLKFEKSNIKPILKNNIITPQINPSDYDLTKQLSPRHGKDKVNISQYDFDKIFDPNEDVEVFKNIAMQKFNYLIQQNEKEELEAKKRRDNDQIKRPQRQINKEDKIKSPAKGPTHSPGHRCSHSPNTHKSLCRKFKQNPARFYTEKPSNLLLKSLNIEYKMIEKNNNDKFIKINSPNNKIKFEANKKSEKLENNSGIKIINGIPIIQLQKFPERNLDEIVDLENISSINDENKFHPRKCSNESEKKDYLYLTEKSN